MHIGYVYGNWQSPEDASKYTPKFVPGIRLPHTWVQPVTATSILSPAIDVSYVKEFGANDVQARQYSTLDLCANDAFTIFVYSSKSCSFVDEVIELVGLGSKSAIVPFKIVVVSEQLEGLKKTLEGRGWLQLSWLEEGRILIVRPDQHILCCVEEGTSSEDVAKEIAESL